MYFRNRVGYRPGTENTECFAMCDGTPTRNAAKLSDSLLLGHDGGSGMTGKGAESPPGLALHLAYTHCKSLDSPQRLRMRLCRALRLRLRGVDRDDS